MRKSFLFISILCACVCQLHAQRELSNPLVDSKAIITKGVALHEAGKYQEAIAEYLKVPASDTGYSDVLHELVLSYYRDSNFVAAEHYVKLALDLYPTKYTEWYGMLADVYDDNKKPDLALQAYDTILARNPYSYLTYFNKGITLFKLLRYDEATTNFQHCIMLNPYYSSAHYFLGQLCMLKGNMVEAMMSFAANLAMAPDNRYHKSSVSFLSTISEVNTTATDFLQKYKPGKTDNFEDIQDILVSKVALDKKYKLKADLEDQIVRQLQVVFEKLEYNANDKGFWMQYYVPMFKSIWDAQQFEPLVFYMFSDLEIKKVNEYNKKEKKKVAALSTSVANYLSEIRESSELVYNKRADAKERLYIKSYKVAGKGAYGKNAKNESMLVGPWTFFYENGRIKSQGVFDNETNRTGEWNYYYDNGQLKEKSFFTKDLANDESIVWNDNGILSSTSTYKDDKLEGVVTAYYYSGKLRSVINYKNGKKEGLAKYYNADGILKTTQTYLADELSGEETIYHLNGKVSYKATYLKDEPVGDYKEYFDNGKSKTVGAFVNGKKEGVWTSYFINGKPEYVENYIKGELDGERLTYYDNGKMESRGFYKKGEIDGKKENFDDDGIMYCETIFERSRLRDIKFFDKKGNIVSNTTSRKGSADISFYDSDGAKTSQGFYSKEGLAEGLVNYYYKNGKLSAEGIFKNGMLEGKKTYYYSNGKISEEGNYKADKSNGYFTDYFINGQVSGEGWYVNDERQGTFINYSLLGNITHKVYYLDGGVHGISEYYIPSGKLDYKEFYDHGWLTRIDQYDTLGNVVGSFPFAKGEGVLKWKLFNGKPFSEANYKYYKLNGKYSSQNGDGSKRVLCYYKDGSLDSTYMSWFPNGKVQIEGKYKDGVKVGTWKYYYRNGQMSELEHRENGKLNGLDIEYNEDGTKAKEVMYKDGELDGENRYYGDNGQLMLVFYNKHNIVLGYSYEDKTGKLLPMIPFEKQAGKLVTYYKNGVKSAQMTFNEGSSEGERILYFSSGKEMITSTRVNGQEHGIKKVFYPSGKIMLEQNYFYGELHGPLKYFNENGTLISDENYYLGDLHGDCKYYTAGKLSQTYAYVYGLLESKK